MSSDNVTSREDSLSCFECDSDGCRRLGLWIGKYLAPEYLCPETHWIFSIFSAIVLLLLLWGTGYSILGDLVAPNSSLFMLGSLFTLSYIGASLVTLIHLPAILGMILVGMAMRNLHAFEVEDDYKTVERILRSSAMVVILIKAGLALEAEALRKLHGLVVMLGVIPCTVEAIVVTGVSYLTLGFPIYWCIMLGFIIAAVAPGIIIPYVLTLEEEGFGTKTGIATLVIAASSIDNILTISAFGVVQNMIFTEGGVIKLILQGVLEVVLGLVFGISWGIASIYIPHRDERWVIAGRTAMVGLGGMFAIHGSHSLGKSGAGPIACVAMAFIACWGWTSQGWPGRTNPVNKVFSFMWGFCRHVLFSLIGTSLDLETLEGDYVLYGVVTVVVGAAVRFGITFLSVYGQQLNKKEMLFMAICWFPKATVQAVIGPLALDRAVRADPPEPELEALGAHVLMVSVMVILVTAPAGALAMYFTGHVLLSRPDEEAPADAPDDSAAAGKRRSIAQLRRSARSASMMELT